MIDFIIFYLHAEINTAVTKLGFMIGLEDFQFHQSQLTFPKHRMSWKRTASHIFLLHFLSFSSFSRFCMSGHFSFALSEHFLLFPAEFCKGQFDSPSPSWDHFTAQQQHCQTCHTWKKDLEILITTSTSWILRRLEYCYVIFRVGRYLS